MPGVERKGDLASCGDANTGSTTVKANGKGITRAGIDTAGALIKKTGGSPTVFVEGWKVSLPGDLIDTHGPKSSHVLAITGNESEDVLIGDGGGAGEDFDLTLDAIDGGGPYITNRQNLPGSWQGGWGYQCWWYVGDITFSYTVTNNSSEPVGPFNIGLWEMGWPEIGQTFYWFRGDDGKFDGYWPILRGEVRQGVIPAGAQVTGTIVLPSSPGINPPCPDCDPGIQPPHDLSWLLWTGSGNKYHYTYVRPRAFTMYADIDQEVIEANEENAVPVIKVAAQYPNDKGYSSGGTGCANP